MVFAHHCWRRPIKHTKTFFFCNMFYSFLSTYIQIHFLLFNFFFTVKHLNIRVTRKFFLDEYPKVRFSDIKNSKKPQKYLRKIYLPKKSDWFSITTIDPIRFMKMLWSISAHWCFQKYIGSWMTFRWSHTPQSRGSGNLGSNRRFNVRSKTLRVSDEIFWKILTKYLPTYSRFPIIMWTLKQAYT